MWTPNWIGLKLQSAKNEPSTKQKTSLDVTKFKAFADDKLNISKLIIFLLDSVENTIEKGENAGNQHFVLFPQRFPKPSLLESLKVWIMW